eukprot:COSAG01_NODE_2144_length_8312_cov_22.048843_6_plen_94_part_00
MLTPQRYLERMSLHGSWTEIKKDTWKQSASDNGAPVAPASAATRPGDSPLVHPEQGQCLSKLFPCVFGQTTACTKVFCCDEGPVEIRGPVSAP